MAQDVTNEIQKESRRKVQQRNCQRNNIRIVFRTERHESFDYKAQMPSTKNKGKNNNKKINKTPKHSEVHHHGISNH